MQTDIGRWSRVDDLRRLHGAVRAAGALAAAARGLREPVRQHRQAAVEQRGQRPTPTCSRWCCRPSRSIEDTPQRATATASTARCRTTARPIYSGCAMRAATSPRSSPWSATGSRSMPTCCRSPTCTTTCSPRSSCCAATCWRAPTSTLLNESLTARDKDLELLLSVTGSHPAGERLRRPAEPAGQRRRAPEVRARRHRRARQGPGAHASRKPATRSILTRTQKQLLAITQTRRDPLVINRIATQAGQVAIPYRILACPLRQGIAAALRACSRCSASSRRRSSSAATCTSPTCSRARSRRASRPVTTRCPGC